MSIWGNSVNVKVKVKICITLYKAQGRVISLHTALFLATIVLAAVARVKIFLIIPKNTNQVKTE